MATRPPGADLDGFPRKRIARGRRWWRNHGTAGPWYFSAGPGGRFDLDPPRGTLYLATTAEAAAFERIGPDLATGGEIPASVVHGRLVSEVTLPVDVDAAHAATRDALRWGLVPVELCGTDDYALTRSWAAAFDAAGFGGIWTPLRFSGPRGRGLAVFGEQGPRSWPGPDDPVPLRELVEGPLHLTVLDPPSSSSVTVLP